MQERFFQLAEYASSRVQNTEVLLSTFAAEHSEFVRFNHARVRQAMSIQQAQLTLTLLDANRRDTSIIAISGDATADRSRIARTLDTMRVNLPDLPQDPHLLYSTEPTRSERIELGRLPEPEQAIEIIQSAAADADLVGIWASGPIARGLHSSLGHQHWHEVGTAQFDWSLYLSTDKAVSRSYASGEWNADVLRSAITDSRTALTRLAAPARTIKPGRYRVYLCPAAVAELLSMLNWDCVSERAHRSKSSALRKLAEGEVELSPKFTLVENTSQGLAPTFDDVGFVRPVRVPLIEGGRHAGSLVGPRTAKEYGLVANADADEALHSAEILPGSLRNEDVLQALDEGIYVGNLWYLNFSDRMNARITGLTRFATFWVEAGRIVAPLNVMRFDDSLFRMLGDHLLDLTVQREWLLSNSTYGGRSAETCLLPGALLAELEFTL